MKSSSPLKAAQLIGLRSPLLKYTGVTIANPHSTVIPEGLTVVIGPNGAGKTSLARIIERGWNFATNDISSPRGHLTVRYVEFNDIHSLAGFKAEYYQQRYESGMNGEVPTVREVMGDRLDSPAWHELAERMQLRKYEDKPVNGLSSGELRKMLVINQLLDAPDLLILDNPYIGLDVEARHELDVAMEAITADGATSIMMLLCNVNEIPPFVTSIIPIKGLSLLPSVTYADRGSLDSLFDYTVADEQMLPMADEAADMPAVGTPIVEMRHCRIGYGKTVIISDISWEIRMGEHWILSGANGAGKSTLLSLIHADNPQGYSNDLSLFGRRRGSGESIWDIKRRIGYVSPEMHLYFNGGHSLGLHVVAQGLNDTVGQYKKLTQPQLDLAARWLDYLHISHLADRPFRTLSAGEQRLLLLARTLIKTPPPVC
ncbi:MAG: ATP-binding cassette domain-containing protein [Candidatus Amulumruptor sp.]